MAMPTPLIVARYIIKTKWAERSNIYYYEPTVAPTDETQLGKAADAILTQFNDAYAAIMPEQHSVRRVECRWYGPGGSGFFANSANGGSLGDIVGADSDSVADDPDSASEDILPDEAAVIIQKKTGKIGRSNQGRIFLTGLSERVQMAGEVTALYRAALGQFATKIPQDINVNSGGYVAVLHARHLNKKNNTLVPITKAYVVNGIGTRKDRRRPVPMTRI